MNLKCSSPNPSLEIDTLREEIDHTPKSRVSR